MGFIAKSNGVHKGIPYQEGDVFKAAGWVLPKHVRGSIYDTNQNWFHWTARGTYSDKFGQKKDQLHHILNDNDYWSDDTGFKSFLQRPI